jgi:alpha-tubulin suppressor-like RCC1 family protein
MNEEKKGIVLTTKRKHRDGSTAFAPFRCAYCGKEALLKEEDIIFDVPTIKPYYFCSESHQKWYYLGHSIVFKRMLYFAKVFNLTNKNLLLAHHVKQQDILEDVRLVILQKQIDVLSEPYYAHHSIREPRQFMCMNRGMEDGFGGAHALVLTNNGVFDCSYDNDPFLLSDNKRGLIFLCEDDYRQYGKNFCAISHDNKLYIDEYDKEIITVSDLIHDNIKKNNDKGDMFIIKYARGRFHAMVLTTHGLFSRGSNFNGQLGMPPKPIVLGEPWQKVTIHKDYTNDDMTLVNDSDIVSVVCGDNSSFIITKNGSLYACGENGHGEIGLGDVGVAVDYSYDDFDKNVFMFRKVQFLRSGDDIDEEEEEEEWSDIDKYIDQDTIKVLSVKTVNSSHTLFLTTDGLYGCGINDDYELGLFHTNIQMRIPYKLPLPSSVTPSSIKSIHCGIECSMFVTYDGELYATGKRTKHFGLVSNDDMNPWETWNKVMYKGDFKDGDRVTNISLGDLTFAMQTSRGEILVCVHSVQNFNIVDYSKTQLKKLKLPPLGRDELLKHLIPIPVNDETTITTNKKQKTTKSCYFCKNKDAKYETNHLPHQTNTLYFCSRTHFLKQHASIVNNQ